MLGGSELRVSGPMYGTTRLIDAAGAVAEDRLLMRFWRVPMVSRILLIRVIRMIVKLFEPVDGIHDCVFWKSLVGIDQSFAVDGSPSDEGNELEADCLFLILDIPLHWQHQLFVPP